MSVFAPAGVLHYPYPPRVHGKGQGWGEQASVTFLCGKKWSCIPCMVVDLGWDPGPPIDTGGPWAGASLPFPLGDILMGGSVDR